MPSRRRFLHALSVGLVAAPLVGEAQQAGKVWRIAYVVASEARAVDAAFDLGMRQLGYLEGQNLRIERWAPGTRPASLDEVMQEVVRLNVDVIVAWAAPVAAAAKRATNSIPIVFVAVRAPVERGIVASLVRPGGNVTGLSTWPVEVIDPKLFELSKELFPRLARVAILSSSVDPPGATNARAKAALALRVKLVPIPFSNEEDVEDMPAAIERSRAQLLIAPDTPLLYSRRKDIVHFAAKRRLPVVYAFREAVEDGGLIALSTDFEAMARRAAVYVDKVLKGAKTGDIPVEQPATLQLAINMRTAKSLGLTIPPSLLLRADQVLE